MIPTFKLVDREFQRALMEIARESPRSIFDIVTDQARRLLRKLAFLTRRAEEQDANRGRARAGWWPSWTGLRMSGTPYVGNATVLSKAEGDFIDRRRGADEVSVILINDVPYIGDLDDKDAIVDKAIVGRLSSMANFADRLLARNLRRRSA